MLRIHLLSLSPGAPAPRVQLARFGPLIALRRPAALTVSMQIPGAGADATRQLTEAVIAGLRHISDGARATDLRQAAAVEHDAVRAVLADPLRAAELYATGYLAHGHPDTPDRYLAALQNVQPQQLASLAQTLLTTHPVLHPVRTHD
ncbi:hypothetical protein [Streptomyces sp. NPDC052114]|uniref:hypothetical protein n=1 Tax=unclassified Streptomyces TaxID=2593676 RepID=UPI003435E874